MLKKTLLQYCNIAMLQYCNKAISSYIVHLTFPTPTSLKKKFPIPFVISQIYRNFAAYWYAARRASNPYANHPEAKIEHPTFQGEHPSVPSVKKYFMAIAVALPTIAVDPSAQRIPITHYPLIAAKKEEADLCWLPQILWWVLLTSTFVLSP